MREKFIIVDGHVHTFSSDEVAAKIIQSFNRIYNIEFVNPGTGEINDVLQNMNNVGIDYTIMANFAPARILDANNRWSIGISKQYKSLIPLVSFHPNMEGSLGAFFEQYVSEGARGIKLHPMAQGFDVNHTGMDDVYNNCREISFPIVFHCGKVANARLNEFADLDMLIPVIEKYTEIPFILTHMADGNVDDVIKLAENFENVFFDTSIIITGYPPLMETNEPSWLDDNAFVDIVNKIGAHRVLFGSDYPWGSPAHDLPRILAMKLDNQQKRLILGENSLKLFRIPF